MMPKKYYDGHIVLEILSEHLQGKKIFELMQAFADAKGADAEPVRHGRWITNFETDEGRSLRCSKCRMVFWVGHGRDGNYCPNCGAKMDEVEEE